MAAVIKDSGWKVSIDTGAFNKQSVQTPPERGELQPFLRRCGKKEKKKTCCQPSSMTSHSVHMDPLVPRAAASVAVSTIIKRHTHTHTPYFLNISHGCSSWENLLAHLPCHQTQHANWNFMHILSFQFLFKCWLFTSVDGSHSFPHNLQNGITLRISPLIKTLFYALTWVDWSHSICLVNEIIKKIVGNHKKYIFRNVLMTPGGGRVLAPNFMKLRPCERKHDTLFLPNMFKTGLQWQSRMCFFLFSSEGTNSFLKFCKRKIKCPINFITHFHVFLIWRLCPSAMRLLKKH